MKDLVDEADRGGFVGVLVWEFHVDFPLSAAKVLVTMQLCHGRGVFDSSWNAYFPRGL